MNMNRCGSPDSLYKHARICVMCDSVHSEKGELSGAWYFWIVKVLVFSLVICLMRTSATPSMAGLFAQKERFPMCYRIFYGFWSGLLTVKYCFFTVESEAQGGCSALPCRPEHRGGDVQQWRGVACLLCLPGAAGGAGAAERIHQICCTARHKEWVMLRAYIYVALYVICCFYGCRKLEMSPKLVAMHRCYLTSENHPGRCIGII